MSGLYVLDRNVISVELIKWEFIQSMIEWYGFEVTFQEGKQRSAQGIQFNCGLFITITELSDLPETNHDVIRINFSPSLKRRSVHVVVISRFSRI
jgi:hypothetical protein